MDGSQLELFDCSEAVVVVETRCSICSEDDLQCQGCLAADEEPVAVNNVVGIFDRQPVTTTLADEEVQPFKDEVVEMLEGLLDRANAGEFTGFAGVFNGESDMTVIATLGALEDPIIFLGGLSRVAHRINMDVDFDED